MRERKSQEHTQQALSGHGQLQPEQLAGLSSLYHTSLACSQTSPTLAATNPHNVRLFLESSSARRQA